MSGCLKSPLWPNALLSGKHWDDVLEIQAALGFVLSTNSSLRSQLYSACLV